MKNVASIVTEKCINISIDGQPLPPISPSHPNYGKIREALRLKNFDALEALVNIGKSVEDFGKGLVTITDGRVLYKGLPVENVLTNRIIDLMRQGFDINPMICFLENLMQNPSFRSVEQLYTFLEHNYLPITVDGYFLGYKAVRADFRDIHSGTILNTVGQKVGMDRNRVDDNPDSHCSYGLHCGAIEYVKSYGSSDGHYMIVKVNPKDVVSVPRDCSCRKLRTCAYEVIAEMKNPDEVLKWACYQSDGSSLKQEASPEAQDVRKTDTEEAFQLGVKTGHSDCEDGVPYGYKSELSPRWNRGYRAGYKYCREAGREGSNADVSAAPSGQRPRWTRQGAIKTQETEDAFHAGHQDGYDDASDNLEFDPPTNVSGKYFRGYEAGYRHWREENLTEDDEERNDWDDEDNVPFGRDEE